MSNQLRRASAEVAELTHLLPWGQDEAEWVAELQGGSEVAFGWIVAHYHGLVYGLVYRMVGDAADAADTTQEVFLKAFRGIREFRGSSSLKTWLYRIAIREGLNQRRWWQRHRRQQTLLGGTGDADQPLPELEALARTPFDLLAARELEVVVHRALAALPRRFRSAVILRDLEGLSYEEVAEVLEVPVGTVKSRILRGRRALREILDPVLNGHPTTALRASPSTSLRASRASGTTAVPSTLFRSTRCGSASLTTGGGLPSFRRACALRLRSGQAVRAGAAEGGGN